MRRGARAAPRSRQAMDDAWDAAVPPTAASVTVDSDAPGMAAGGTASENSTLEVLNDAASVSTSLETLAARASILQSLPQHRLAASSVLLIALLILAVALIVIAARRPMLRSRHALPPQNEWAPIIADANAAAPDSSEQPSVQLPALPHAPSRSTTDGSVRAGACT